MIRDEAGRSAEVLVMEAAMQWLLRLREEPVTEYDIAEWLAWYERDEAHKRAFDRAQAFWDGAGELGAGREGAERLRRLHAGTPAQAAPGTDAAAPGRSASGSRRRARPGTARRYWAAGGIAACLTAAALWLGMQSGGLLPAPHPPAAAEAGVRRMGLADGSQVELAARSSLAVRYSPMERLVELRDGEAYFTVHKDRSRPFVVQSGGIRVRAVGTAFNVRQAQDRIVVTVAEGTVEVYPRPGADGERNAEAGSRGVRINAGHQVTWADGQAQPVVAAVDPARALAWRQGRLEFIEEPLSQVVVEVNRYAARPIEIADREAGRLVYTGTVLTRATDEWLMALPANFPVRLTNENGKIVITRSPAGPVPDRR